MKRNYLTGSFVKEDRVVSLEKGGTSSTNKQDALNKLNLVPESLISKPRGLIPIDPVTSKIPESYLEVNDGLSIEVDGPFSITVGTTGTYKITNFDSRVLYLVSSITGSVILNGDTVLYTAPTIPASGSGFKINDTFFNVRLVTL